MHGHSILNTEIDYAQRCMHVLALFILASKGAMLRCDAQQHDGDRAMLRCDAQNDITRFAAIALLSVAS